MRLIKRAIKLFRGILKEGSGKEKILVVLTAGQLASNYGAYSSVYSGDPHISLKLGRREKYDITRLCQKYIRPL